MPIPSLGSAPAVIDMRTRQETIAGIADALLSEGLLREEDWIGEMGPSVVHGLTRWANAEMGADAIRLLNLSLRFTDDWEQGFTLPGHSIDPCAAFGLMATHEIEGVTVGPAVRRLEAFHRGAGWAVYGLVLRALDLTVGVASPGWAYDLVDMWDEGQDWGDEDAEQKDPDALTRENFLQLVPKKAVLYTGSLWRENTVRNALRKKPAPGMRDVLQGALDLSAWTEAHAVRPNGLREFQADTFPPVIVRWSDDDEVPRVFDDWTEQIAQMGDDTDFVWVRCFDAADDDDIRAAARDLTAVLGVLVRADALLRMLGAKGTLCELLMAEEARVEERVRICEL